MQVLTAATLRQATLDDVPVVCQLVRELREFHGRSGDIISEEKFKQHAFSDKNNISPRTARNAEACGVRDVASHA